MMHRTHAAGLIAVAAPSLLAWHWGFAGPAAVGLVWTRSLTALFATIAGMLVLWPHLVWLLPVLIALAVVLRQIRPDGTGLCSVADTFRTRLLSWLYLWHTWSWRGGDPRLALEAAHLRSGGLAMEGGPARNEWLQIAYKYGAVGVVVVLIVVTWLIATLRIGDPMSATLVSAGVVCAGTSPLQAFKRWLTGGDGPLFGPPLKASLTIHLDAEYQVHLYGVPDGMDYATRLMIARSFFNLGEAWMKSHGLSIEEVAGDARIR